MTTTMQPRVRHPRYGKIHPKRARIFKDPYAYPNWQVYYGPTWVGSAHSEYVAQLGARIAASSDNQGEALIAGITKALAISGHNVHWMPGAVHIDHKGIIHESPWDQRDDGRSRWPA